MKRTVIIACGAALLGAPLALSPLYAQTAAKSPAKAAAKAATYKAPKNAFGQPDIGGFWTNASITSETRSAALGDRLIHTPDEVRKLEGDLQADIKAGNAVRDPNDPAYAKGGQAPDPGNSGRLAGAQSGVGGYNRGWLDPGSAVMRVNGEPRTSFLTTPDGRPPARKTAAAAGARGLNTQGGESEDAAPARGGRGGVAAAGGRGGGGGFGGGAPRGNPEDFPLAERCIMSFGRNMGPPMLPNGFYNNNYRMVQGKDSVAIWVEMVHDVRVIRLNAKHRTDGVRPWGGDTIGRWEGDTLVAETTNIPQAQAYSGSWQTLTVTEKFTRVSPTRLRYQYIITDPAAWDQPWGGEYEFDALPPGQGVYEYACHEGNYAMEGMLAGARAEDQARAQAASGQGAR